MIPFGVAGCYTPGMREGISFEVSAADRERLAAVVAGRSSRQKHVWRAAIILASAEGCGTAEIMRRAGVSKPASGAGSNVHGSGRRWLAADKTRRPGKAPVPKEAVAALVERTLAEPPGETTHGTSRAMAAATGLAISTVQKIWRAHGLQPHRLRSFKLSRDPEFAAKVRDVVGLYVDPPAHAVVLLVDEKSEIQALDRTQPGLPMKKGRAGTMTHDYIRNGTTTLFAALNVLDGSVVGQCMQRHRHQEFLRFLNRLEREIPAGKLVHVVLDNYGSHKHPEVRAWLERHPRWTFHFTPRPPPPGSTRSRASSPGSPSAGSSAACSIRWSIFRPPSTATSPSTTPSPNPSSGPPTPMRSSPPPSEGTKRWIRSTSGVLIHCLLSPLPVNCSLRAPQRREQLTVKAKLGSCAPQASRRRKGTPEGAQSSRRKRGISAPPSHGSSLSRRTALRASG